MPQYLVTWEIQIDGRNPIEAAERCKKAHRDPFSLANVFTVKNERSGITYLVDLDCEMITFVPPKPKKKKKK